MMFEQILQNIGLTKYETKVYAALLNLGESTSGQILREAGIHSGKIYDILEGLKKKGFVSEISVSGIRHFSPSDPERILEYLDEKKNAIVIQQKEVESMLPSMLAKVNELKSKVNVEVFFGYEGMKAAHLKETKRYVRRNTLYVVGVSSFDKYSKQESMFFENKIFRERTNHKVKTKKIFSEDARKEKEMHEAHSEIKFLPYSSLTSITVIEDLTIIGVYGKNSVFISIENKDIADNFIQNFEYLWKIAKV